MCIILCHNIASKIIQYTRSMINENIGNSKMEEIKETNLTSGSKTKMLLMEPILTDTALYHLFLFFPLWIRVRATTRAVQTFEVMVIWILYIFYILIWENLAEEFPKFGVPTITSKASLGPQLHNLPPKRKKKHQICTQSVKFRLIN